LPHNPLYLATAVEAALAAGRTQRKYFRQSPRIDKKGAIDLVTEADLAVEHAFRVLIAERFPDHTVLGEEAPPQPGDEHATFRWIIDPIDGTTNFAHGLAVFCVSIALAIEGRVELGVIYDPIAGELFTAERGAGSWLNGRPLRVSKVPDIGNSLLCTGFPSSVHDEREGLVAVFDAFLGRSRGVRRLGSAALELCYVAAGRLDGFWEPHLHAWDTAAGALIVEAAGGKVTNYAGGAFTPFFGEVVASNGLLHDELLATFADVRRRRS
jgi:myo-inositol-1(or 4)-monophosphatase